ncbi:hypothetical protein BC940DRAFT_366816 [Gongronella butleri]|nr:hypothetical protein BC940DRAFT_366816 [Gongronella butleri]
MPLSSTSRAPPLINTREPRRHMPPPPSPTLSTTSLRSSMSWIAEKSPQDLVGLLKSAYSHLREKEKDLVLAAEVGRHLLTSKAQLEKNYESLLASMDAGPSTDHENSHAIDDDDDDDDTEAPEMRFIPSLQAQQIMMEVLEQKNKELQLQLDQLENEKQNLSKSSIERTKELEHGIHVLKSDLDMATAKIHELEAMQTTNQADATQMRRGSRRRRAEHASNSDTSDSDGSMDELQQDLNRLQGEKQQAIEAKRELESKLKLAMTDLRQLKQQFQQFEFSQDTYKSMQQTYERQMMHIHELNTTLEEHRALFQKLRDRGINVHGLSSPTPSVIMTPSVHEGRGASRGGPRQSLLDEMERLQMRHAQENKQNNESDAELDASDASDASWFLKGFLSSEGQDIDMLEQAMAKSVGVHQGYIDQALNMIQQLEKDMNAAAAGGTDEAPSTLILNPLSDRSASLSAVGAMPHHPYSAYDGENDDDWPSTFEDDPTEDPFHLPMVIHDPYSNTKLYPVSPIRTAQHNAITVHDPKNTRPGLVRQWMEKALHRIWRWCRFAIILSTAVMISIWSGPDSMLLTENDH